ncbi:serine hydrolase [Rhodococcus sp. HNM0563]|uniref:serine hydrolase n=1 Tax=Rhodococcus sp. HNM0563 TaxID=2716339 RepID=UPI003216E4FE
MRWGATAALPDRIITTCAAVLRTDPDVTIATEVAATTDLITAVRSGMCDLAVVEHPALLDGIEAGPVTKVPRWVVVPAGHRSARAERPRFPMLCDLSFATAPRAGKPAGFDATQDILRERGLDVDPTTVPDDRTILAAVAAGRHFGISTAPPGSAPGVAWLTLAPDAIALRVRIVWRPDAGCSGWLHARRCSTDDVTLSVHGDERVVLASVYKLPLFLAFCAEVDAGRIDPASELRIDPSECTPGSTGIASMRDPVTMSRRDLAASMMTVSDNAAADVLLGEIGPVAVHDMLARLGLERTNIVGGTADMYRRLVEETDSRTTVEAFKALTDSDAAWSVSAYDPAFTSATTAEEMTRLLAAVWAGDALSAEQTTFVKNVMRNQIWPHRIAAAFPYRGVSIAGKTGTIGIIRNEVAVVEFPGEHPVAVAVFTRAARAEPALPVVDAAIGEAARIAVTELRAPNMSSVEFSSA